MKYLVISDVHANYPALEAVLTSEENVDIVIVAGDLVGLGGFPSEVVNFAMKEADIAVRGNHDIAVVEKKEGHVNSKELSQFELKTTITELNQEQMNWLNSLDSYVESPENKAVVAHAKPSPEMSTGLEHMNAGLKKRNFTRAASKFDDEQFDYVIVGHTHNQAKLDCSKFGNDITVLNPGSVGQPISSGKADYAVIENGKAKLKSVEYDKQLAVEKLEKLGVPFKWWEKY